MTGATTDFHSGNLDSLNHPDLLPSKQKLPRAKWFSVCCKPQAESIHDDIIQREVDDTIEDIPNLESVSVQSEDEPSSRHMVASNIENASQLLVGFLKMLWAYLVIETLGAKPAKATKAPEESVRTTDHAE